MNTKRSKITPVSPFEYSKTHSRDEIEKVCKLAGTTYDYWLRIKDRRQRPSVDLARSLVSASGGQLDLDALLFPKELRRGLGAPPLWNYRGSEKRVALLSEAS